MGVSALAIMATGATLVGVGVKNGPECVPDLRGDCNQAMVLTTVGAALLATGLVVAGATWSNLYDRA